VYHTAATPDLALLIDLALLTWNSGGRGAWAAADVCCTDMAVQPAESLLLVLLPPITPVRQPSPGPYGVWVCADKDRALLMGHVNYLVPILLLAKADVLTWMRVGGSLAALITADCHS